MSLAKDLSGLPSTSPHGEPPVKDPSIGPLLADAWASQFVDTEEHPLDLPMSHESARIRFSWAGSCGRQIGYRLTETDVSEPLSPADHWRFGLGHLVHDQMQQVVKDAFPGAEAEVKTSLEDGMLAGHGDIVITRDHLHNEDGTPHADTKKISIEIKTINGFGFKRAIGARGAAEGPRTSAKLQGALNALAQDADELVILYLSLENLSPREMQNVGTDQIGRFCAEWRYAREEWEPWATTERDRMLTIAAQVDAGAQPDAYIPVELPAGALIVDPVKGFWQVHENGKVTDAGSTWMCNYCAFQSKCSTDMKGQQ